MFTEVSRSCYLSNGKWPVQALIRIPIGAYGSGGPYHSSSVESVLLQIKGIKVVYPSNAADMKGLVKAAFYDPNPVVILEHKGLYWSKVPGTLDAKTVEPDEDYVVPLGKARIEQYAEEQQLKAGNTLTVITYGMGVYWAKNASQKFKGQIEIVDLIETIENHLDKLLFMDNLEIEKVVKLKNGMPPLFIYQLNYVKEFIIKNKLNFDYIIKIRNDIQVKINDIANFLNNKVYIPPAYWRPHEMYKPLNDHMFIMPFELFKSIDISIKNIINTTINCHDCEELNYKLIKPNEVIHNNYIKLYKTFGGAKVFIEN
jgi:hypothetical protein